MFHRKFTARTFAATLMAAASATALLAAPAFAQDKPDDSRLDVVIITANQREENLQDVPVSAASLPDDQIEAIFSSGEDVLALAARVPALYAESSNGRVAPRFYIRGLGNTDFDLAASQPVSIIMDDVVMENVVLKSTPIFDVDRVEVYRGPQGTLFGRNTTAGIVRFTSVKPSEEFDDRAKASYGEYGSTTFDGAVGGAIAPGVSARASVLVPAPRRLDQQHASTATKLGGFDEVAGRVQLAYQPDDKLDVLLNVHARDLDGTAAVFRANVITPGTNGLNSNYDRDRVAYNQGGGNPQNYSGWGASANVGYDFGDVKLTSITAYESTERLQPRRHRRRRRRRRPGLHPVRLRHAGLDRRSRPDHAGIPPRQRHRRPALLAGRRVLFRRGVHRHHGRSVRLPAADHADARQPVLGRLRPGHLRRLRRAHRHRRRALHGRRQGPHRRRRSGQQPLDHG